MQLDAPNPFTDGSEDVQVASVGYRYRKWQLGENVSLVVRCEVDGIQRSGTTDQLMTIKALNEFDPKQSGVDWRQKLDSQRGAVLATELKNNGSKLARWTMQSLLAGADLFKLGYARTRARAQRLIGMALGDKAGGKHAHVAEHAGLIRAVRPSECSLNAALCRASRLGTPPSTSSSARRCTSRSSLPRR